jgi:hypothetical protein
MPFSSVKYRQGFAKAVFEPPDSSGKGFGGFVSFGLGPLLKMKFAKKSLEAY